MKRELRLLLGDQLNRQHSWFQTVDPGVTYLMMEMRSETDYVVHHLQKVIAFFEAMRRFASELSKQGHQLLYINLDHPDNRQSLSGNIPHIIKTYGFNSFAYQLPDEYRLDRELKELESKLACPVVSFDTEHFFTSRDELATVLSGKKQLRMESFYRYMRMKHQILMDGSQPLGGQWNFDQENRKKVPKGHVIYPPLLFQNDVSEVHQLILREKVQTIGSCDVKQFIWPLDRDQALQLLDFFVADHLPLFGTFEDAMVIQSWSVYHSRLSFALNVKMISPREVIDAAIRSWESRSNEISLNQIEGFVRQILGWREYMRGMYWAQMPEFATMNYLGNERKLPDWFWTGETKMNCLRHVIKQSLDLAYAHHIQRLMVTGNFALLSGVHPDEVDQWYLGIYIDALEWVEITNTRGMSQFADGGVIASKPYVSSAAYIDKMSDYCGACHYNRTKKVGERSCPFNSLYWHFFERHRDKLSKNPRIAMMYNVWRKMPDEDRIAILDQAEEHLTNINNL